MSTSSMSFSLIKFVVSPSVRRLGIGRQLLSKAIECGQQSNVLHVDVEESNRCALNL